MRNKPSSAHEFLVVATRHLKLPLDRFRVGRKIFSRRQNRDVYVAAKADAVPFCHAADHAGFVCNALYRAGVTDNATIENCDGSGWCVLHDDVGTKGRAMPEPPPTWITETSPGNFQYAYVLKRPEPRERIIALAKAIVAKYGGDGASATCPRWMRLPFRPSPKLGPAWITRLVAFDPRRLHTVDEIARRAKLTLERPRAFKPLKASALNLKGAASEIDRLADVFAREGMLLRETARVYDVVCPWWRNHTQDGREREGAALTKPSPGFPRGGFRCHHGSCTLPVKHDLDDVRRWARRRSVARIPT